MHDLQTTCRKSSLGHVCVCVCVTLLTSLRGRSGTFVFCEMHNLAGLHHQLHACITLCQAKLAPPLHGHACQSSLPDQICPDLSMQTDWAVTCHLAPAEHEPVSQRCTCTRYNCDVRGGHKKTHTRRYKGALHSMLITGLYTFCTMHKILHTHGCKPALTQKQYALDADLKHSTCRQSITAALY